MVAASPNGPVHHRPVAIASSFCLVYPVTWTSALPGRKPTGGENTEALSVLSCPDNGTVIVTGWLSPPMVTPTIVIVVPLTLQVTSPLSGCARVGPSGVWWMQSEPV